MYLIDTNIISDARNPKTANPGVTAFFAEAKTSSAQLYLSVITIGELRRGAALIRHRGDIAQAEKLETWLTTILTEFAENILPFDHEAAQLWGILRVPDPDHAIDKQIAATALIHDLILVTRNTSDVAQTGVRLQNPFTPR